MSTVVNPGTTPKVYAEDGKVIAAGERLEGVELDAVGQALVDDGKLRVVEEKPAPKAKGTKSTAKEADADSPVPPARRSQETPS